MSRQVKTLTSQRTALTLKPAHTILQRKCACGTHTIAGGECDGCRGEGQKLKRASADRAEARGLQPDVQSLARPAPDFARDFSRIPARSAPPVQAKLTVSAAGDHYEQEADRTAEAVMRMSDPRRQPACGAGCHGRQAAQGDRGHLQTKAFSAVEVAGEEAPQAVHETVRAPGQPLDSATRAFMESRFGHDFSRVRVHADGGAAESAQALRARAYTVGPHVVFGPGEYVPSTAEGRQLLAHELTHVLQQTGSAGPSAAALPTASLGGGAVQLQRPNHHGAQHGHGQTHHGQAPARPAIPPPAGRWILVSLRSVGHGAGGTGQVRVFDGATLRRNFPAAGGRAGHTTPIGDFHIDWRDENHVSSEYGHCIGAHGHARTVTTGAAACGQGEHYQGADMHYFQRFAPSVGFHHGNPSAVSHGCIHLSGANAATLWGDVGVRTEVIVCAGGGCQPYLDGVTAAQGRQSAGGGARRGARHHGGAHHAGGHEQTDHDHH